MVRRSTMLTLLALFAFVALLWYTTLSGQRVECAVTVEYKGQRNSATASGASQRDAQREAQTTACGPIAKGMNETIACSNAPPVTHECRTL
jgi:hypothetical protein